MPLDTFFLTALKNELAGRITGMKIEKIQQPEHDQVILTLRGFGASPRLLISAGTGDARVHLTDAAFENPQNPPMFCMLLRKHLAGARIKSVTQSS
jgi:predicted ribosome quality control (RQC) complex YloA/Tae2 family protein